VNVFAHPGNGAPELVGARDISIMRGSEAVLDRVTMSVCRGEIVTLMGPAGAGKSTLVRALLGLAAPDSGTVVRRPLLRIGYIAQGLAPPPGLPMTVGRFMTLTRPAAAREIGAALAETGAAAFRDMPLAALPRAAFRRVALARALLARPELLVLDEPVAGLDGAEEAAHCELIAATRARLGCGVLVTTRNLHLVMRATDRVICLDRRVCCAGAPDVVRHREEHRRLLGEAGAAALAVYVHRHDSPGERDRTAPPLSPGAPSPGDRLDIRRPSPTRPARHRH
jgi:zinc transport system ATP-binding protein